MHTVIIEPANNGFIVRVGCMTLVATDKEHMLSELSRYFDTPQEVEKEYNSKVKYSLSEGDPPGTRYLGSEASHNH